MQATQLEDRSGRERAEKGRRREAWLANWPGIVFLCERTAFMGKMQVNLSVLAPSCGPLGTGED